MRTLGWVALWLPLLGACRDRGDKPVDIPVQNFLYAEDQTLPNGVIGEPYDTVLRVTGGDSPYSWELTEEAEVPAGLNLSTDGHVVGVPAEAGDFTFAVMVYDVAGRENRVDVSISIGVVPQVVKCGESLSGRFDGGASGPSNEPNLTQIDSLAWIGVQVPDDLTTRVDLVFDLDSSADVFVERPGGVVGSGDLIGDYVQFQLNTGFITQTVSIDASTDPSLTGYLTQPTIPLLLVGRATGAWQLTIECTDGPIFTRLDQYPTRLGDPIEIDYNVFGDNAGVRIWTEDPLPEWMLWDETTGTVTGTALEAGTWEFDIRAETPDGRTRVERSIIGVYEVIDVECGDVIDVPLEEGYLDGEFIAFYDPRGFGVYRLPLGGRGDISGVTLRTSGESSHYLGLASPNPDWLRFYGGAQRLFENGFELSLDVDPSTYPSIEDYADETVSELFFSNGSLDEGTADLIVEVECDTNPRPDFALLPVVQPLTVIDQTLSAIGGAPPYTWSATGLPSGLKLSATGILSGQTGAVGTYDVAVTVSDKAGGSSTRTYTMYVGTDEACAGYKRISCGDSVDGTFDLPYYADGSGDDSTKVFCLVPEPGHVLSWEIYADDGQLRVDIADPGRSADDMFGEPADGTFVAFLEEDTIGGVGVDAFSTPSIDDFFGIPFVMAVRAFEPGSWTVHLTCP
jgi:Putative Ig domain